VTLFVRRCDTPPHLSNLRLAAAVDVTAELSEVPFPTAGRFTAELSRTSVMSSG
jgi:hypothetical protein